MTLALKAGAVFVENGTPGLSFGAQEDLMGFRGVPSADIFLDDRYCVGRKYCCACGRLPQIDGSLRSGAMRQCDDGTGAGFGRVA